VITLTIWTTEAFSPTQAITTGKILAEEVASFQARRPDVRVEFVLKKPYGKGGILDFLLSTGAIVPDLLPDLVAIDLDELARAVEAGMVQPLDGLIPAELLNDLYPAARAASSVDGKLFGLQYQADLDHLAYDNAMVSVPPASWSGVLDNPGPYTFPAGGQAELVNDAFLIQYLAVRPWPAEDDPDAPFLEKDALIAVLQFYQDGASRGILPARILEYKTTDESWRDYLAGQAAMTETSAHRYLLERDSAPGTSVAGIPGINGPAAAINRGWALALVTSDPERQAAALQFAVDFLAPETAGRWNWAARSLPTRQAALDYWGSDAGTADSYSAFAHQQLLAARPRPAIPNYAQTAAALQQAVEAVLTGTASPEEAAAQAVQNVQ
jgi:multiple sugar transport system substrate-binding protein